jgi:hypothetical protein
MGQSWVFGRESTYHGLLRAKLPHMISEWVEEFGKEMNGNLTFLAFHKFVLRRVRIDERATVMCQSTSQSEDRDPRDVSTPVRSRSDSGLEEEVLEEDSDSAMHDSLSVTGQRRTTHVCGCPLCGEAHLLMRCRKFLSKVPIQRWGFCRREKLCLRCLGKNHFSKHCHHMSCSECGGAHHSLLHDHGIHQPSRALRSRPTRRAEERHARRGDNSEEDEVSGAKARQSSQEAR